MSHLGGKLPLVGMCSHNAIDSFEHHSAPGWCGMAPNTLAGTFIMPRCWFAAIA